MVQGLLSAGIRVAGVDRDREPLEALTASAREQGKAAELLTIATDLTDDSAADAITKATRGKFGRIDILVNNAGTGSRLPTRNCNMAWRSTSSPSSASASASSRS
jgi:NADP-dependent 3-hydroxy acid dehydrogenase YdfG